MPDFFSAGPGGPLLGLYEVVWADGLSGTTHTFRQVSLETFSALGAVPQDSLSPGLQESSSFPGGLGYVSPVAGPGVSNKRSQDVPGDVTQGDHRGCQPFEVGCHSQGLLGSHFPGLQNGSADLLSRGDRRYGAWSLNTSVTEQVFFKFGRPLVDLFASQENM